MLRSLILNSQHCSLSVPGEPILSNAEIFDFELSEEDIRRIDKLDKNKRFGSHPDTFTF